MAMTYQDIRAARPDYGMQLEILVALLYHEFLRPTDNAIDGGANSGIHATSMAGLLTDGHLFCFEPVQRPAEGLARNLASLGASHRSTIFQKALGERAGAVEFMVNDESTAHSHIRRVGEKQNALRVITAPMVTIDETVGQTPIAFIKLDLEGADFLALRGGERVIKRDRPLVVFETLPAASSRAYGYSQGEFFQYFRRIGYAVHDLHGAPLTPDNWADAARPFEYIGAPENDPRLKRARSVIVRFWRDLWRRPVLESWPECVMILREPKTYLAAF